MGRKIVDRDFHEWEAFASTGDFGRSRPARVIFRCMSDPTRRPRHVVIDGDKSDAEAELQRRSDEELSRLFQKAEALG